MKQKLTVNINEKTIENAKHISHLWGKSISEIIEEYFNSINEEDVQKDSLVEKSSGALKIKTPVDLDWKKEKLTYLKKKPGV